MREENDSNMKIDVHAHTKKTKQGEAEARDIEPKQFIEIIAGTDVRIVAITNHNVFDYTQYAAIKKEAGQDIQVWPGVELDVLEDDRRAHLLVIISPQKAQSLSEIMTKITSGKIPDTFSISIKGVIDNFDHLNPIYIAHYHQKKPDLLDESIEKLVSATKFPSRVIKEVTNSISAGIYISHGHRSIFGSDIQDWEKYGEIARDLPDLRLPVESYEHFCLLLEKDANAINTILDKKKSDLISLRPFEDDTELNLKVYNDINVLFGSKGTGKTMILNAIAKYYRDKGISADVFETGAEKLGANYDLKGKMFSIDLKTHGVDYCTNEIDSVKTATEKDVTNPSNYIQYFSTEIKNKNAKKIIIQNFVTGNLKQFERNFASIKSTQEKITEFLSFIRSDQTLRDNINTKKIGALETSLQEVISELDGIRGNKYVELKINQLFNSLIATVKREISRKTGTPERPVTTGFQDYALNRIGIEVSARKIKSNLKKVINIPNEYVGNLGRKGDLYCKTDVVFQDGHVSDGSLSPKSMVTKHPQKYFSRKMEEIIDSLCDTNLFEKIEELNSIENSELIKSLYELLLFKRYFVVDNKSYLPSNGEISMLLLHKELSEDKDVYILDEPEKSLSNDYINDTIVPLIKEKAKVCKKIFISTHDANIAVRTLPYNSIYREHKSDGYDTYVGNPFSNNLTNIRDRTDTLDWKEISMKTLEGGKEAFGERGRIYGDI